jgi:heat shock protein HslJ
MTDQQMHERLQAAGARWRGHEPTPAIGDVELPHRASPRLTRSRVTWLLTAAAVLAAAVGIAIPLFAGGSTTQPPASTANGLYGVRWTWSAASISGGPTLPPTFDLARTPWLRIGRDGRYQASDGCNSTGGLVQVRGNRIVFNPGATTLVGCIGPLGKVSAGIDHVLRGEVTWRIVCNTLMITNRNGDEVDYNAPRRTSADIRCMHRWSNRHAVK